jgi:hypothetical protein
MGRHLVTVVGAAAWVGAVLIILRSRETRGVKFAWAPDGAPGSTRVARAASRVVGTVTGGVTAGVLVLGMGGRLMMRILAATSPDGVQGRITDADEVVGEVTLGGTLGLVLFAGVFGGVLGALLFGLLRAWLPERSLVAGGVAGAIGAGVAARMSGLVDPDNHDFAILEPVWLAVLLGIGLIVTFALLGAVLMDRWAASWPAPGRSVSGIAGMLPIAPLLLAPPAAIGVAAAIAFRAFVPAPAVTSAGAAARGLRVLVLAASVAGGAWTLAGAAEILAA